MMKLKIRILNVLSFHVGKTTMEISKDIHVNLTRLWVPLFELEKEGLARSQWRQSTREDLERRGGNRAREYFLTSGGIKKREEAREKKTLVPRLIEEFT